LCGPISPAQTSTVGEAARTAATTDAAMLADWSRKVLLSTFSYVI